MSQQNQNKKVLVSFPPVHQLLKRYNSFSTRNLHESSPTSNSHKYASFISHGSRRLQKSLSGAKLFFSNHESSFEKERHFHFLQLLRRKDEPNEKKVQEIKRELDKLQVMDTYKKLNLPTTNPRLLQKRETLFRISDYENFSPFKRNYAISRTSTKQISNPQLRMKKSSIERK